MSGSFIEQARRRQVIEAAIVVLAQEGYARASIARIAAQARISKSIITYHFMDKDALFEALFAHVVEAAGAFITPFLEQAATAPERVFAYMTAQLAYMETHRDCLLAIGQLATGHTSNGMPPDYISQAEEREQAMLVAFFEEGQRAGLYRAFDKRVMAQVMAKAIEAALTEWAWKPQTDLQAYGKELIVLFDRAMRADKA